MKHKYCLTIFCLIASIYATGQINYTLTFNEKYCIDLTTLEDSSKFTTIMMP